MAGGRPTKYSKNIAAKLCSKIALGESLRSVCKGKDMPSTATVYIWFSKHEEFVEQYARAKQDSADSDADKIEEIAEKVLKGEYEPQQARVAIDAFKWTAGKKRPKKYGESKQLDHTSSDGTMTPQQWVINPVRNKDD